MSRGLLPELFNELHQCEMYFRFENNDDGYILSIIDRKIYPRVWADNFQDQQITVITETPENIINKTVLAGKDWTERFYGESIIECISQAIDWYNNLNN